MKPTYLMIPLFLAAIMAGAWLSQPKPSEEAAPLLWQGEANPACRLNERACVMKTPLGVVLLQIQPRPIPVMKPLQISLTTDVAQIKSIKAEISGLNMEMGKLPFNLPKASAQEYKGNAMLPICTESRMHWLFKIQIETQDGLINIPFQFYTAR